MSVQKSYNISTEEEVDIEWRGFKGGVRFGLLFGFIAGQTATAVLIALFLFTQ